MIIYNVIMVQRKFQTSISNTALPIVALPEVDERFGELARGGNRDVRRYVRSACSSAGNDFTQTIDGKFNTERCTRCRVVSFHPPVHLSLLASHNILPFFLVLVSVFPLLWSLLWPPTLSSSPFADAVPGMFEPRRDEREKEGVLRMPEGLAGLPTHRNIRLRFSVANRFEIVAQFTGLPAGINLRCPIFFNAFYVRV